MSLARLSAFAGCYYISGTHTSVDFDVIVPQEDTVFSVLTGLDQDDNAVDFLVTLNITSSTIKQGTLIAVPSGQKITAVTVSSGSAMAYNRA